MMVSQQNSYPCYSLGHKYCFYWDLGLAKLVLGFPAFGAKLFSMCYIGIYFLYLCVLMMCVEVVLLSFG